MFLSIKYGILKFFMSPKDSGRQESWLNLPNFPPTHTEDIRCIFSWYFKIRAFLDQYCCDAKLRNLCLAVWSLARKFVEAGEFLNWLIPFLKFGGLQKLIVWRARQSFTRNTKHLLRLLKTMKDNLIKFCWNFKSPSAAHQLAPTGAGVAPLADWWTYFPIFIKSFNPLRINSQFSTKQNKSAVTSEAYKFDLDNVKFIVYFELIRLIKVSSKLVLSLSYLCPVSDLGSL